MTTYNIVEFHHDDDEYMTNSYSNYLEASEALIKQIESWKNLSEEMTIQTTIKEHTPYCYSLYQDNEIKITWEIIVITE